MEELFILRNAKPEDKPLLDVYTYNEGMDNIPSVDGVVVAANSEDLPVGFIRIVQDEDGVAYVYPIVTYSEWRGYGVGRALIEDAIAKYGELRLVSRGSSRGFYEALGFIDCEWSMIAPGMSEDCPNCSIREECEPSPMLYRP